jgi:hypothetical protein
VFATCAALTCLWLVVAGGMRAPPRVGAMRSGGQPG